MMKKSYFKLGLLIVKCYFCVMFGCMVCKPFKKLTEITNINRFINYTRCCV